MRDLPVVPPAARAPSPGRHARWRALALLAVHVLVALHLGHWLVAGRTLSPVEPSESMYALELGHLNAGFVFFVLAIASTLVFGRFACGWACHLLALQDGCAWLLRRLGLKPQPFRSRALLAAPFALGFYMFVWPTFRREVLGEGPPFPGFTNHLLTDDFWRTFPGPAMAVLTLAACGVVVVVALGSKGFCTYGCPYGAFFTAADKLAPFRIVADGCRQSGQCTRTCTSNVLVHEEVRRHGMVVDAACMKCMDCVDGCPSGALSFGLAKPSILVGLSAGKPVGAPSWAEDAAAAAVALAATLAFRGLYDGPPLLMAIGLGALTAWVALVLWRLARRPTVRAQWWALKAGGSWTRAGLAFALAGAAWLAFSAHSGLVQWDRVQGRRALARTEVSRAAALAGSFDPSRLSAAHRAAAGAAARHFGRASALGLVPVPEVELGLAWTSLLEGDVGDAERRIREVLARDPSDPARHENLVELLLARGRLEDAADALAAKLASTAPRAQDACRLGELRALAGRLEEAAAAFATCVALSPGDAAARFNLGATLRRLGRPDEARKELLEAARIAPGDPQVEAELDALGER